MDQKSFNDCNNRANFELIPNNYDIIEMNSQVDSNGEDCFDYKQLAININLNDMNLTETDKETAMERHRSIGSWSATDMKSTKSLQSGK